MVGSIIVAHLAGDYLIQTDRMAIEKTERWWPAVLHAVTYGLPFLFITRSPAALVVIVGTHAVIDHYRLARHFIFAKAWLTRGLNYKIPSGDWDEPHRYTWNDCRIFGFTPDKAPFVAFWLMIIVDNTIHILINIAAVRWLA